MAKKRDWKILLIPLMIFCLWFYSSSKREFHVEKGMEQIKGVCIKNKHRVIYYKFILNGKIYSGSETPLNTRWQNNVHSGDSIYIQYSPLNPDYHFLD